MDVTILTSISEGQPLTILEGFAAHKPVIATDVGNCRGLIYGEADPYGAAGILTHIMNVEEISEAMVKLAENAGERLRMGENGYNRVMGKYRMEHMQEQYQGIYENFEKGLYTAKKRKAAAALPDISLGYRDSKLAPDDDWRYGAEDLAPEDSWRYEDEKTPADAGPRHGEKRTLPDAGPHYEYKRLGLDADLCYEDGESEIGGGIGYREEESGIGGGIDYWDEESGIDGGLDYWDEELGSDNDWRYGDEESKADIA
jgi:hypothetical protein